MELNTREQIETFSKKTTYTEEEKKYIMQRLDEQRRKEKQEKCKKRRYIKYSEEEKQNILRELNDKRLEKQLYEEIEKRRVSHKKIYRFDIREFYKFTHMDREYFIETKDIKKLSARPQILTMYHRTFGEMKKRDFLMKIAVYSDKIFISDDMLRVYFKGYSLESE
ncbi:MAG TPA: hypothetical protein ENJ71_05520 [Epsilonproteobacteria bacterium]|nr:hypothetical protein [Campylobacterota bacterium]